MQQRSEEGLFQILEKVLKDANEPLDCVELYNNHAEIRERAANPNRVSDYLGNMWRKGQLVRLPAPRTDSSKTRWLYAWKGKKPAEKPKLSDAIAYDENIHTILDKPNCHIEDNGRLVTITLPEFTITIQHTR